MIEMARRWTEVKADLIDRGLSTEQSREAARRATDEYVRAWRLAEVRKLQECKQSDLADTIGLSQPRVSAIEKASIESTEVGTLRAYIEGLGGQFKIVATFDDFESRIA